MPRVAVVALFLICGAMALEDSSSLSSSLLSDSDSVRKFPQLPNRVPEGAGPLQTCPQIIRIMAIINTAKFERLVFSQTGSPVGQFSGTTPQAQQFIGMDQPRADRSGVQPTIDRQARACSQVAHTLDYVFRGGQRSFTNNIATPFTDASFMQRVNGLVRMRADAQFHFRLRGVAQPGKHDLGHHFSVYLRASAAPAVATVYMAFEDKYTLSEWIRREKNAANVFEAGGKTLTMAQLGAWSAKLGQLVTAIQGAGIGPNNANYPIANAAYTRLFGVKFEDFPAASAGTIDLAAPNDPVVQYAVFSTNDANCRRAFTAWKQQRDWTCTGAPAVACA